MTLDSAWCGRSKESRPRLFTIYQVSLTEIVEGNRINFRFYSFSTTIASIQLPLHT